MRSLPGSPAVPHSLKAEYSNWVWDVAYQYGPDGLTYRLSNPSGEIRFLKLARRGGYPEIKDEADRMVWASRHLPVPRVLSTDSNQEVAWMVTEGLGGQDATSPTLAADPEVLVRTLAHGLRRFHEAPVDMCPFDFRLEHALSHVRVRLEAGQIEPARDFHNEFSHLSAQQAIASLEQSVPATEDLVVCHGDYCLPNILIEAGMATGFVDLGELGVADRWWDLAVASWSITWNLGPGYEDFFLEEYGVQKDPDRIGFYRLLYDVVS